MTDVIRISRIHGFGYHGVFEEERKVGQDFYVDLDLFLDLSLPSRSDVLDDTIDYSSASELALSAIQGKPFALIEKLAGEIADELITKFPRLEKVAVTVHKPMAPVSVSVNDISVTVERRR